MSHEAAKNDQYAKAGVDIDAGNALVDAIRPLVRATARPGSNAEIGGFGGLFDLKAAGFIDPVLVAANDGVGTKVKIAIAINKHDTIGIDLVAMCVNDLIVQGAEPLFFLDYFATGKLRSETGVAIIKGIAEGCGLAGCALIGGETAEMPGVYSGDDYDLAGFAVGAAERGKLLPKTNEIKAGDIILGLGSSGLHSNGYSLVRKIVKEATLDYHSQAPFAETSLGEALLEPTRIYVRSLLKVIRETDGIHAMAHITGGGFVDNIPRALPDHLGAHIDLDVIDMPQVFNWVATQGNITQEAMLKTFNCGIGMIIVTPRDKRASVISSLQQSGEKVTSLGEIVTRRNQAVTFSGNLKL